MPATFDAVSLSVWWFVIVPGAQVHRIAAAAALRHAEDVDEKPEAVVRRRRQQLDMREVREVC